MTSSHSAVTNITGTGGMTFAVPKKCLFTQERNRCPPPQSLSEFILGPPASLLAIVQSITVYFCMIFPSLGGV